MIMRCENYLCIYEQQGICELVEVELDVQGKCKDCVYIDIEQPLLTQLKKRILP